MFDFEKEGVNVSEISENKENTLNTSIFQEIKDFFVEIFNGEDGKEVIITGDPYKWAEVLDWKQGDVYSDVQGNCGLVSTANFLDMCGIDVDEQEMVDIAVENGLCYYNPYGDPSENGGTTGEQIEALVEMYGVESTVYDSYENGGSIEDIANAVENGHAVIIAVDAGYLWDEPSCVTDSANHAVTVTGVERDAETGEITGLVICDSGRGYESDAARVVSVEQMKDCYTDVVDSIAVISDQSVR